MIFILCSFLSIVMDVDSIDYESLPDDSTLATHLVAGAAAGIMEHSVMYPFDCVKVSCGVLVFIMLIKDIT